MSPQFESVALTEVHDVTSFDSGVESLDSWLVGHALRAQQAGTARTFVWTTPDTPDQVWAYFSLAPTEVARADLSRGQSSGFSRVPSYLLARLALHRDLQGSGLGAELLVDALSRAARAAELGGGRLIVVDAIDAAAAEFCRHHGFAPVKGDRHRLVLKIATVRVLLG